MQKTNKIIYWVASIWLALGMLSSGTVQLIRMEKEVTLFTKLGYPVYFLTLLGIWKILGVIFLLIPKFPLVKEWVYAGFFFAMSGALYSHLVTGTAASELFGPALLLLLTIISWAYRPANRKPGSIFLTSKNESL